MRILLTNDDGIHAEALAEFRRSLSELGDVIIVAPAKETSGAGHSFTFNRPLTHFPIRKNGEFFGHAVEGTPTDCVKLGVTSILDSPPDVVISGINIGENVGINILYSGTVAAAVEGAMLGVPSIAFSLSYSGQPRIADGCIVAASLLKELLANHRSEIKVLNINVPNLPRNEIRGVKITRQSCLVYDESFEKRTDPRGGDYYWITGRLDASKSEPDSDIAALIDGYVSITPLHYDLTHYDSIKAIQNWKFNGRF